MRGKRGYNLLGLMVGIAVTSIVIFGTLQVISQQSKTSAQLSSAATASAQMRLFLNNWLFA